MSKPFNYSKWDNIELSDDEDDVHPNIDKASWFRLKHRSRVEREEKEEADKKKIRSEMAAADLRTREILQILSKLKNSRGDDSDDDDELEDKDGLEAELKELQKANQARQEKLDQYEKNKKWNVDNISHVVEERTIVNTKAAQSNVSEAGFVIPDKGVEELNQTRSEAKATNLLSTTESAEEVVRKETATKPKIKDEANSNKKITSLAKTSPVGPDRDSVSILSYHEFTEKYADVCEEFMTLSSMEKSRDFLLNHGNILLQENASNYLLLASLEDEMNGYRDKMRLTARQSQIVSNLADLAKSLKTHPGNVITPFFKRLEEREHFEGFMVGVESFIENLIKRAVVKRKEMDEERAQSEAVDLAKVPREERLGPGGLDPIEVFESLPEAMQAAFESRNTEQLKTALEGMPESEAAYHMKRCVASGLWNV